MFQIRNDMELIEALRISPLHVRQAALATGIPVATALRILRHLEQQSILDFKREGRNKKYFLKATPDAHQALLMTEHYKLLKLIQRPLMRQLLKHTEQCTAGELVVLFGSYARGDETKTSDIDLYVETENTSIRQDLQRYSAKLSIQSGALQIGSAFSREINKEHIILQNPTRYYQVLGWPQAYD